MSFMAGAICATCGSEVLEDKSGRIACGSCELPTDCCLCPERFALPRSTSTSLALPASNGRLSDRILDGGCRPPPFAQEGTAIPASALEGAAVILADSVAIYASAARRAGHVVVPAELPDLLPPYPRCFIEMRAPEGAVPAWGCYLATLDLAERGTRAKVSTDPELRLGVRTAASGGRWMVLGALAAMNQRGCPIGPLVRYQLGLDEMGRLMAGAGPGSGGGEFMTVSMPRLRPSAKITNHQRFRDLCTSRFFAPILVALSFLHCEGSTLEPDAFAAPTGARKRQELRAGRFEDLLALATRPGMSPTEAACQLVPGRFDDGRGDSVAGGRPGGLRWCPEAPARAVVAGADVADP